LTNIEKAGEVRKRIDDHIRSTDSLLPYKVLNVVSQRRKSKFLNRGELRSSFDPFDGPYWV